LLEKNPEKISWDNLSENPNAISLLEKNPDKISWFWLSRNPNAIHLLEKNPEKISWDHLSVNPNAIHLLEKNPKNIDWVCLSRNPSIFVLDYQVIKENKRVLNEEIIQYFYHPKRMSKWIESGETMDEFCNIYG
jgi:ribosomal protein L24E